ncbi:transporter [Psychrobacillus sp. NEAU-3TGS]|uniref:transporter n=1 Tax=Psychrobacillus sp. NEAU-3TGS TaxID=2995412 RepID=UPI002495EFB6|nr:transporter [Psychrobacillus sp. NEAU-3TGS]MDI2586350.1 transporter [Psychrobacillus sp. NEAU-3TGS]
MPMMPPIDQFPGRFPGQFPSQFPGQFPGQQGPSFPPSFPPGQQQNPEGNPPTNPPPSFTPQRQQQSVSAFAVDPGAIRGCLFRNTYIWLINGNSFWFYPTFVGRRSVAGFRWTGRMWTYYGTDLNRISSFQCF